MSNAAFTYDITVEHVQVTTDFMQKVGVGKMATPPVAKDWVKLDLLARARRTSARSEPGRRRNREEARPGPPRSGGGPRLWEGLSRAGFINPLILPSPTKVALRWWGYLTPLKAYDPADGTWLKWLVSGELLQDAAASLYRVLRRLLHRRRARPRLGLLMESRTPPTGC